MNDNQTKGELLNLRSNIAGLIAYVRDDFLEHGCTDTIYRFNLKY